MKKQSFLLLGLMGLLCVPATVLGWPSSHCGPNRTPYDPALEGCCQKPDGTYAVTTNPENADLDELGQQAGVCNGAIVAYTFCYNGEPHFGHCSVFYQLDPLLQTCVMLHEYKHSGDPNMKCQDCASFGSNGKTQQQEKDNECEAYKAFSTCLQGLPHSIPGWKECSDAAGAGILANCY